jgi:hypothetical protein
MGAAIMKRKQTTTRATKQTRPGDVAKALRMVAGQHLDRAIGLAQMADDVEREQQEYPGEKLVPISTFSRLIGVTAQSIRNAIKDGRLPQPIRTAGGHRRFGTRHVLCLAKQVLKPHQRAEITRAYHNRMAPGYIQQATGYPLAVINAVLGNPAF